MVEMAEVEDNSTVEITEVCDFQITFPEVVIKIPFNSGSSAMLTASFA